MQPNVIFIVVDALRAESVRCLGHEKGKTPALDALGKKGVIFENCFSCTNASDPALTCLMAGMYPRTHGITHHSYEVSDKQLKAFDEKKVLLLQEILKQHEYHTYGLDFLARWHKRGYEYYPPLRIDRTTRKKHLNRISRLFNFFGIKPLFKKLHHTNMFRKIMGGFDSYPNDTETTATALELMTRETPFFLFVHYWGVHKPYTCPAVEEKLSRECYDNAVETVDAHIAQLTKAADDDTLFIVVGDHGESLGEHGISFDHHGLYDTSLHVPLIFSGKDIPIGMRIPDLVSTVDIFKTVLDLAGVEYMRKDVDGITLLPVMRGEAEGREFIFAEENYYQDKACIRTTQHKFIKTIGRKTCGKCDVIHGGEIELYDLAADPGENNNVANNVAEKHKELVEEFSEKLNTLLK